MQEKTTVSIVIPTYNEAENIVAIIEDVIDNLNPYPYLYEILIIDDDSKDGTADLAQKALGLKGQVIRRQGVRSLSLSVLEGIDKAKSDIVVVMDADGSHPPKIIPDLIKTVEGGYELAVASRYVKGGGSQGFPLKRKIISQGACLIGRFVTNIKDNTSGFFALSKRCLSGVTLTPQGFKIGLEIFVKAKYNKFKEVPYVFLDRKKGKSKLNSLVINQYISQIFSLFLYKMKGAGR